MDIRDIRAGFPILEDDRYIYFDNAATSQRPKQVLEAVDNFYKTTNANPLRGLYEWSIGATEAYEQARSKVAAFLNAASEKEIIFTRNTTESINLIAYSYGLANLSEGDEIVVSIMEHHSNILPWQMVANKTGAVLKYLEYDDKLEFSDRELSKITDRTKIVAVTHVSNVLGVTNPVEKLTRLAHEKGAVVVIDGAQSTPHKRVDVRDIDADFYAFSGHKMLAPMGIGALYGKRELLESMPPFLTGGEMIELVTRDSATYAEVPHKFEAGTVNAGDAVGLAAAIDYIETVGFDFIREQEDKLTSLALSLLKEVPYITLYGADEPERHSGIITFNIEGCHPHDVSSVLDSEHICIRAGHHCAQPLLQYIGVNATARASLYFYNTEEEVERFVEGIKKVRGWLGYEA